jgi:RNA polymerase sigma factor (sigma-70 family)
MKYARQNHLAGVFEDATAEGWLAVVEAVRKYDSSRPTNFAGYVNSCVKYAIWNFFKKNRRKWQMEIPEITNIDGDELSFLELVPSNDPDIVSQIIAKKEFDDQIERVKEIFPKLRKKHQQVIQATIIDKQKLREVAEQMGITSQAVHNLQKRGLLSLREKMTDNCSSK